MRCSTWVSWMPVAMAWHGVKGGTGKSCVTKYGGIASCHLNVGSKGMEELVARRTHCNVNLRCMLIRSEIDGKCTTDLRAVSVTHGFLAELKR